MIKNLNKNGFFSVFLALLLYYTARMVKHSPSLPKVSDMCRSMADILSSAAFYGNLLYTIKIVVLGVLIAFICGTALAIVCSMSDWLYHLIMPIINSTKNVPSIALFPLFIVLMGIGDAPRIFVIIWNSAYPIISSTLAGLDSVEKEVVEAAWNCGTTKWQMYRYIKIPLAFINILEGLKISAGNGFIAIVVAEMLGATKGLGYMVLWSANAFRYPEMYCYILVIALVGFFINVIIEYIIKLSKERIYT